MTAPTNGEIGRRLKDWRTQCGWTQGEVAELIGLTRTSVANIEAGRQRLFASDAALICGEMGIRVDRLLGCAVPVIWEDIT